ncbi:protein-tyrosine-phosphatase [Thiocapsa imhoffii]|uniref:protein-tyrosine-phosphatase n=1 Tax=Thiocapsa imhoffii TaxID=382777 RepID=A0A9X0WL92_9GAMM|nr:CpsB/CapC family capsule biosynthesis tyrosine phosphatase [Thiocapsa imhoffii]MBK1646663.1 protein-tyrosine-phosphatase [Thiocapsa imhoffii]
MIDTHCHILPGIDDGAHNDEIAVAMAQAAVAAGTERLVCTPHHFNGIYDNPSVPVRQGLSALQQRLHDAEITLPLHLGAELHLVPELPSRVLDGSALTYNDRGRAALIELPKVAIPLGTETVLEQLLRQGVTPVIAHPERNLVLARDEQRLGEWVSWGCKAQLTAQSCSGEFGERLQWLCRRWIELGWIHVIASDAHRPVGRSPDTLRAGRAAVARWRGEAAAHLLTHDNPRCLLTGDDLSALPPLANPISLPRPHSWLKLLPWRRKH